MVKTFKNVILILNIRKIWTLALVTTIERMINATAGRMFSCIGCFIVFSLSPGYGPFVVSGQG
jgi:hypothetical protein